MNWSFEEFINFLRVFEEYSAQHPGWGRMYMIIADRIPTNTVAPNWKEVLK